MQIKLLHEDAVLLEQQNNKDCGYDLRAMLHDYVIIMAGQTVLIDTSIALHIEDENIGGFIYPRSGLASKFGITVANNVGVIDSSFTRSIKVALYNRSENPYKVNHKDRIAQLVFQPVIHPKFDIVNYLDATGRGEGFGSSGVK